MTITRDPIRLTSYAFGATIGTVAGILNDPSVSAAVSISCGLARTAFNILVLDPYSKESLVLFNRIKAATNEDQKDDRLKRLDNSLIKTGALFSIQDMTSIGFNHGLALGTVLSSDLLSGSVVLAAGFFAEIGSNFAFAKPLHLEFNENGEQIL